MMNRYLEKMPDEQTMFNLIKIHSTHTDDKTYLTMKPVNKLNLWVIYRRWRVSKRQSDAISGWEVLLSFVGVIESSEPATFKRPYSIGPCFVRAVKQGTINIR